MLACSAGMMVDAASAGAANPDGALLLASAGAAKPGGALRQAGAGTAAAAQAAMAAAERVAAGGTSPGEGSWEGAVLDTGLGVVWCTFSGVHVSMMELWGAVRS